tara:strand:+ start:1570 stop:1773 length:204 start_codon:yes stop_codon:yes gene_type:complete
MDNLVLSEWVLIIVLGGVLGIFSQMIITDRMKTLKDRRDKVTMKLNTIINRLDDIERKLKQLDKLSI